MKALCRAGHGIPAKAGGSMLLVFLTLLALAGLGRG